jgi:hypothetical protein
MIYRVIIKGTPAQARKAATNRGVILNNVRGNRRIATETTATASAPFSAISAWFAETTRAPFTGGDLLWFGGIFDDKPEGNRSVPKSQSC